MERLARILALLSPLVLAGAADPYEWDPNSWQRAVITEVMVAPVGVPAGSGQWIELRNLTDKPLNLQGMVLRTTSGGFHVISPAEARVLDPGGIVTLGRLASAEGNGGAPVDYSYGGDVLLAADTDVILLLQGGELVDIVAYGADAIPVEPGRSLSLEPPSEGSPAQKHWCYGRSPYGDLGNLGTPGSPNGYCDDDRDGYAEDQGDCDDVNPAVHPGATEDCNGLDDDCDGLTDEDVSAPDSQCPTGGVCDAAAPACGGAAGWSCAWPPTHQDDETLCDGLDNDCDGLTDEGLTLDGLVLGSACPGRGECGDGTVVCSPQAQVPVCSTLPGGPDWNGAAETCNGQDDDCDGETDEDFAVGGTCQVGAGACLRTGHRACSTDGTGTVCDADAVPAGAELCGDGLDNDCDGETDEGFPVNEVCSVGMGACAALGKYRCSEDRRAVTCQAVPGTPGEEVCGNGIDDDCDGTVDETECRTPSSGTGCSAASTGSLPWWLVPALLAWLAAWRGTRRRRLAPTARGSRCPPRQDRQGQRFRPVSQAIARR